MKILFRIVAILLSIGVFAAAFFAPIFSGQVVVVGMSLAEEFSLYDLITLAFPSGDGSAFNPSEFLETLKKTYWKIRCSKLATFCKRHILKRKRNYVTTHHEVNQNCDRLVNFKNFRSEYLSLSSDVSVSEFEHLNYSHIIVGSDVVWKPMRLLSSCVMPAYFLKEGQTYKKIAYAASIGISNDKQLKRLSSEYFHAIKDFDFISIRESSTTAYMQSILTAKKIFNCIDPVFLCSKEEYENLIPNYQYEQPFIYVYVLGKNKDALNYAEELAKTHHLQVYYHINSDSINGINTYGDGPIQFLSRIRNAHYIITDSFHGTAFSIIFKKQFFAFTRGILSVRLLDFLNSIGLSNRLLSTAPNVDDIEEPICYDKVWDCLNDWIANSYQFLQTAINSHEVNNENCSDNADKTK